MTKIYFKLLVLIVLVLWITYFIQYYYKMEPFTPRINSLYNPSVRRFNQMYENFMNPIKGTIKSIFNKIYRY